MSNSIIANIFYTPLQGGMVGVIQKESTVVVSNGVLTAHYTSRQLLGGGLEACVDSQTEYDENAKKAAVLQFKLDCARAADAVTYEVCAGTFEDEGERNYKVCATFADPVDLASYVTRYKLTLYPFCVVQTSNGKEYDYVQWVNNVL